MERTLVVWCPDWPLTAAGIPSEQPAAVLHRERVQVCSAGARAAGIRTGMRRREAQACCPDLAVVAADPDTDHRLFAAVITAAQELVPTIEVVRPGLLATAVHGPARALGGEQQAAEYLVEVVDEAISQTADLPTAPGCAAGIADTRFGAVLAARTASGAAPPVHAVVPGEDAAFVAPQPVTALRWGGTPAASRKEQAALDELVTLLTQLGIPTLGDFAALPAASVTDRFGLIGGHAHRMASGADRRPVIGQQLLPDLSVTVELEEPAAQVETVAFAVRHPAEKLLATLEHRAQACTLLEIEAHTEHAEQLARRWRTDGFTPGLVVDRVRWQLDGWLSGSAGVAKPTAGVTLVRLDPVEVISGGQQQSLLASAAPTEAVTQTVTRLQGMLGPEAVYVGVPAGGRDPSGWVTGVPWDVREIERAEGTTRAALPWPGRLPSPAPATVLPQSQPAEVADPDGRPVQVSGRGTVSGVPARIRTGNGPWRSVAGWAGPWPADEHWWEPAGRRRARFQVTTDDGAALLLVLSGRWWVEAVYD